METNNIVATNRQSAKAFKEKYGQIEVKASKNSPGKFFFVAGDETGYVSPKAKAALEEGKGIEDFQMAKISIDNKPAIWCMMVVGAQQPTLHTL